MRKIQYFEHEITVEEYIEKEICANGGTKSRVFKDDLTKLCQEKQLPVARATTKKELLQLLLDNGCTHEELAKTFGLGVSSKVYQDSFGIDHATVKRLEKLEVLKVVGSYEFRAYGSYHQAPLYDLYQYCCMTDEDMQQLLKNYPKGTKRKRKSDEV